MSPAQRAFFMQSYSLQLAGVLLTFVLKVAAAYVLCLGLARVLRNPRHRFLTWLGFLLGAGLSWIALLADQLVFVLSRGASGATLAKEAAKVAGEHVAVPASWSIWIGRIAVVLTVGYIAGAASLLAVHLFRHMRLRQWLKHGRQPSSSLQDVFQDLCQDFNISRCRVLILPKVSSPATVYWWTPRILLPEVCEKLVGSPQLGNVLRHELIHTLRCDYLWATLGDLLCALLFFHPAVWQARKQLMMERELACDLGVIETHPEDRADYADSLAAFVRLVRLQQRPALGVDFASSPSFLSTRIRNILAEPAEVPRWKELVCDAAIAAFIVAFASVSPALSVSLDFSSQAAHSSAHAQATAALAPFSPQAPGLHRRHNRVSLEYVNTPGTVAMENWAHQRHTPNFTKQQAERNAVAPSSSGPMDVDGPPIPIPFNSVGDMPIPDLDPLTGNARYQANPANEDK
jgi:beta-lactamase regulating signal transducer with metallopeptidase domain